MREESSDGSTPVLDGSTTRDAKNVDRLACGVLAVAATADPCDSGRHAITGCEQVLDPHFEVSIRREVRTNHEGEAVDTVEGTRSETLVVKIGLIHRGRRF